MCRKVRTFMYPHLAALPVASTFQGHLAKSSGGKWISKTYTNKVDGSSCLRKDCGLVNIAHVFHKFWDQECGNLVQEKGFQR